MKEYNEILRLKEMLEKTNIGFKFNELFDGYHIEIEKINTDIVHISGIEHKYSYGNEKDLLEICGGLTEEEKKDDGVLGYLTAEEVFERIMYCYENNTNTYVKTSDVITRNNSNMNNNLYDCIKNKEKTFFEKKIKNKQIEKQQEQEEYKQILTKLADYEEQRCLIFNIAKVLTNFSPKSYTHAKVKIETWCDQPYVVFYFYVGEKHSSKEDVMKTPLINKSYIDKLNKEFTIEL